MTDKWRIDKWRDISAAPENEDVIILDNHDFVHRAAFRHFPVTGWVPKGSKHALFNNEELQGWMPLPPPPQEDDGR